MSRYAMAVIDGLDANRASDLDAVALVISSVVHKPFLCLSDLPLSIHKLDGCSGRLSKALGIQLFLFILFTVSSGHEDYPFPVEPYVTLSSSLSP